LCGCCTVNYWTDGNKEGDTYDLCYKCAECNPDIIAEKKLRTCELPEYDLFYLTQFGSLSDWIPIYRVGYPRIEEIEEYATKNDLENDCSSDNRNDIENDMINMLIYYNINKDSPNYQQFAISSADDHGRSGRYNIITFRTFDDLKKEIEPLYEIMLESSVEGGWDGYYNNSITLLMNKLGMKYHYG
jgi:hypothetical protein